MAPKEVSPRLGLPSFFVVGASKAGTTSLQHWLSQQPDVCLPLIKETHFFSHEEIYSKGIEWYLRQFPEPAKDAVVGDICPSYQQSLEAPHRIRGWIEAPDFVFIFRHPIDRAFSSYQMKLRNGIEQLEFVPALLEEPKRLASGGEFALRHASYMANGRYAEQTERYQKIFPKGRFLFVKFEDLTASGKRGFETYRSICEFIGVKSSPALADRSKALNRATVARSQLLGHLIWRNRDFRDSIRKHVPRPLQRGARWMFSFNQRPIAKQRMPKVPREIIEQARAEIRKLETVTGWDLSDWIAKEF